ncbi:SRPBCC family protein [Pseudonocardia sp. CA-107938]|uniref:SRPBCC family protein n=1 Tax=Pseudonocardia sp. CA-107938 TaxID=3240021 RepID=UPI003D8B580F
MEWTGARYADQPTVEVQIDIDAPPERVWPLVSDPVAMPKLCNELQRVEWIDGATGARVGARFQGFNSHAAFGQWSTPSTVSACAAPEVFAWDVGDPEWLSASWRFTLEPVEGGTRLTQWMRMGPGESGLSVAITAMPEKEQKIVFVRLRELETNMTTTLAAIKQHAEQG